MGDDMEWNRSLHTRFLTVKCNSNFVFFPVFLVCHSATRFLLLQWMASLARSDFSVFWSGISLHSHVLAPFFFPPTMSSFCFFSFSLSLCSAGTGLKVGCTCCSFGSQKCCYQNRADLPVFCKPISSTSAELGPESKQSSLYFAYQENSIDGFDFKSWTDKDW